MLSPQFPWICPGKHWEDSDCDVCFAGSWPQPCDTLGKVFKDVAFFLMLQTHQPLESIAWNYIYPKEEV